MDGRTEARQAGREGKGNTHTARCTARTRTRLQLHTVHTVHCTLCKPRIPTNEVTSEALHTRALLRAAATQLHARVCVVGFLPSQPILLVPSEDSEDGGQGCCPPHGAGRRGGVGAEVAVCCEERHDPQHGFVTRVWSPYPCRLTLGLSPLIRWSMFVRLELIHLPKHRHRL